MQYNCHVSASLVNAEYQKSPTPEYYVNTRATSGVDVMLLMPLEESLVVTVD